MYHNSIQVSRTPFTSLSGGSLSPFTPESGTRAVPSPGSYHLEGVHRCGSQRSGSSPAAQLGHGPRLAVCALLYLGLERLVHCEVDASVGEHPRERRHQPPEVASDPGTCVHLSRAPEEGRPRRAGWRGLDPGFDDLLQQPGLVANSLDLPVILAMLLLSCRRQTEACRCHPCNKRISAELAKLAIRPLALMSRCTACATAHLFRKTAVEE